MSSHSSSQSYVHRLHSITARSGRSSSDVFSAFCRLAACALAAQTREAEYLEEAKRWKPDDLTDFSAAVGQLVVEMEKQPFTDLIGPHYLELSSSSGRQARGEFYTPPEVCQLMAEITIGEIDDSDERVTLLEPACGAGGMILAAGRVFSRTNSVHRMRVTAIDINPVACDMAYINTTLWGIPCRVLHGNALTNEFWHGWNNLHWMVPWLRFAMRPSQTVPANLPPQGEPPCREEVTAIGKALVQREFSFDLSAPSSLEKT